LAGCTSDLEQWWWRKVVTPWIFFEIKEKKIVEFTLDKKKKKSQKISQFYFSKKGTKFVGKKKSLLLLVSIFILFLKPLFPCFKVPNTTYINLSII
jgi:hypothetical protein